MATLTLFYGKMLCFGLIYFTVNVITKSFLAPNPSLQVADFVLKRLPAELLLGQLVPDLPAEMVGCTVQYSTVQYTTVL